MRELTAPAVHLALAVLAAASTTLAAGSARDPVVSDVVRMLEAGVEASTVLVWLQDSGARPDALSPDDLIALAGAKAPAELTERLLALARGQSPATIESATAPPAATGAVEPSPPGKCCPIELVLEYRAIEPVEGEDEAPSRDLFVYIDGRFVARLQSRPDIGGQGEVRLRRVLEPGPHTLRLAREIHDQQGRRVDAPWRHDARVCPEVIEFQVASGTSSTMELDWIESLFAPRDRGPLSWAMVVDGERRAGRERTGTPKSEWPPVCEDIETAVAGGATRAAVARGDLQRCVRWADLWTPAPPAPSRAEILADFQRGAGSSK